MKTLVLLGALVAAIGAAQAPEAYITLPDVYSLQFENDWVRVVRVRYGPHAKIAPHAHTALASAYVYLSDAGPVIFRHVGGSNFAARRPATTAGGFRVFRGIEEIHEVENTSDTVSEFLRVEFKTDPREVDKLRGRFPRETPPAGETLEKVQFENAQVRITRLVAAAGRSLRLVTPPDEPALLIALTAPAGKEQWVPAGRSETLGPGPLEMLRFDFKTEPRVPRLRSVPQNR
jgi:hypothetical protein